jgi:hypothetical protein
MKHRVGAVCAAVVLTSAGPSWAALGTFQIGPIGTPLGTDKVVMQVTISIKGDLVMKTVTIPKGAIVPVGKVDCAGLTPAQCEAKSKDAYEKASQAKAKVFADAINKAFAADFAKINKSVTTSVQTGKARFPINGVLKTVDATLGSIIIPNVPEKRGNPIRITEGKILGEFGNGGQFQPPSPGKGKASFEGTTPGTVQTSTGLDPNGDPSAVQFGVDQIWVSEVDPYAGETDAQVLQALAGDLGSHGVTASYDPGSDTLSIPRFPGADEVVWSNTDTGLAFETDIAAIGTPEPGAWLMLLAGLSGAGAALRRRRRTEVTV